MSDACFAGMLLRMFMNLYDLEIIDEDAFLRWKEDLTDVFPGKGKALFQVGEEGKACLRNFEGLAVDK